MIPEDARNALPLPEGTRFDSLGPNVLQETQPPLTIPQLLDVRDSLLRRMPEFFHPFDGAATAFLNHILRTHSLRNEPDLFYVRPQRRRGNTVKARRIIGNKRYEMRVCLNAHGQALGGYGFAMAVVKSCDERITWDSEGMEKAKP